MKWILLLNYFVRFDIFWHVSKITWDFVSISFVRFFWRKICHGNLALTKWIVKNDDFLLFIFIFLQKRTKERSNKINFILFVVEAKRKVANFLVRRARPKTDFRQPKIFPGVLAKKRGGLSTFLVHPGEPPNWSARTKENEKFLGPKRKLTDTYCEVSYFLSVLGQSMSVLGRIVADTYCEVSESMSVLGRIVADTYCEVSQGLLIWGAYLKRSVCSYLLWSVTSAVQKITKKCVLANVSPVSVTPGKI